MEKSLYERKVEELLKRGEKENYSHLLIILDKEEQDTIPYYVKKEQDIKDIVFDIVKYPNYKILEVYNYEMDLEEQIKERRSYHIDTEYTNAKVKEAYEFAKTKHKGQKRKNGEPYINHPICVANLVNQYFEGDIRKKELLAAAYLHDTLEDTDTTESELNLRFGSYVTYLVKGVTNNDTIKHQMGKTNYLCYKMENMESVLLDLKLCDRLANVYDLKNASLDFIEKYSVETTVILNYLTFHYPLTSTQRKIIEEINLEINKLRSNLILERIKEVKS